MAGFVDHEAEFSSSGRGHEVPLCGAFRAPLGVDPDHSGRDEVGPVVECRPGDEPVAVGERECLFGDGA